MQKNSYEYLNASNPFSPKFLQERNLIIDTKYKTIRTSVRMFEEKVYKIQSNFSLLCEIKRSRKINLS